MVSIVVVTYNSEDVIQTCIHSCTRAGASEIIVVDNASSDGTVGKILRNGFVQIVVNPSNRGFAAAANQGIRSAKGDLVLLLNPDVELSGDLSPLERVFERPEVGAAAGMLTDSSGSPQDGFNVRRFPRPVTLAFEALGLNRVWSGNPVNAQYRQRLTTDVPEDVEQPAGAFLMIRKSAWESVTGFDEGFYPVWFEDVDFCVRLQRTGYKIVYVPSVRGKHVGGHSASTLAWADRQLYWYGSLLRYSSKHFSSFGRMIIAGSVMAGSVLRMIASSLFQRSLVPVWVYSKVIRLAARSLRGAYYQSAVAAPGLAVGSPTSNITVS